jgi:cold shock CspA family protein
MSTGTVKWFSDAKGSSFKTLQENAQVQFEVANGPKGPHAIDIRPA